MPEEPCRWGELRASRRYVNLAMNSWRHEGRNGQPSERERVSGPVSGAIALLSAAGAVPG